MTRKLIGVFATVGIALAAVACGATATDDGTAAPGASAAGGVQGDGTYAGVPVPTFGITETAPATPKPWTAEVANFFYVDPGAAGASDDHAFGHPGAPRQSMPRRLPAGAVVEVHGRHGERSIECEGTAAAPSFIVGAAGNSVVGEWVVMGSHCIVERLNLTPANRDESGLLILSGDHLVARFNESSGAPGGRARSGMACGEATDILFYRNKVHDHGALDANFDQDASGISVARDSQRVWVLENEAYRNSGDGINVNPYPYVESNRNSIRFVYIAGNKAWGNKQTGIWAKMSADIVVSGNEIYGHRPSNSSLGQCTGFQYGSERMWFINNDIYDCDFGILIASDFGGADGKDVYIIGNSIHDIQDHNGSLTESAYSDAAIMVAGASNRYIVNNTIDDTDGGIQAPYGGSLHIANNIIAGVQASRKHIFIEGKASVTAQNNLFDSEPRLDGAQCSGCKVGAPAFVDSRGANFALAAGSPAVDAGLTDAVYATFQRLYGIDINRDRAGVGRPQGGAWDIGAYERRP